MVASQPRRQQRQSGRPGLEPNRAEGVGRGEPRPAGRRDAGSTRELLDAAVAASLETLAANLRGDSAMIAKGNIHSDGVKLAAYLMKGEPGERAELIDMRGFGAVTATLSAGLSDEQVEARDGTKADAPFFHVQYPGGAAAKAT